MFSCCRGLSGKLPCRWAALVGSILPSQMQVLGSWHSGWGGQQPHTMVGHKYTDLVLGGDASECD